MREVVEGVVHIVVVIRGIVVLVLVVEKWRNEE